MTEEDLAFLISDIRRTGKNTIKEDRDNIDDFRAAGLLKEVDGGFTYTIRAFELMKYGLAADDNIQIPKEIQERMMAGMIKLEDIVNVDGETLVVNGGTVTD